MHTSFVMIVKMVGGFLQKMENDCIQDLMNHAVHSSREGPQPMASTLFRVSDRFETPDVQPWWSVEFMLCVAGFAAYVVHTADNVKTGISMFSAWLAAWFDTPHYTPELNEDCSFYLPNQYENNTCWWYTCKGHGFLCLVFNYFTQWTM